MPIVGGGLSDRADTGRGGRACREVFVHASVACDKAVACLVCLGIVVSASWQGRFMFCFFLRLGRALLPDRRKRQCVRRPRCACSLAAVVTMSAGVSGSRRRPGRDASHCRRG